MAAFSVSFPRPPLLLIPRAACTASTGSSPCWSPPASAPTWTRTRRRWSAWAGARRAPRSSGGEARGPGAGWQLPGRGLVRSRGQRRRGSRELCTGGTCCPRALCLQGCPWASAAPAGFVSPLRVFACGCVLAGVCLRTGEAAAFFPGLTEAVETSSQPPRPRGGESCPLSGSEGWGGMAET